MIAQIHDRGADANGYVERRPRDGVITLDAWLCVVTGGEVRVFSREHAYAFERNPKAEGLLVEFLLCFSRVISIVGEDGVPRSVQARPARRSRPP